MCLKYFIYLRLYIIMVIYIIGPYIARAPIFLSMYISRPLIYPFSISLCFVFLGFILPGLIVPGYFITIDQLLSEYDVLFSKGALFLELYIFSEQYFQRPICVLFFKCYFTPGLHIDRTFLQVPIVAKLCFQS